MKAKKMKNEVSKRKMKKVKAEREIKCFRQIVKNIKCNASR